MSENNELRYLVQAGKEIADDTKLQIVQKMTDEGDMCVTVSSLYNELDASDRTIRRHIQESLLIYRDTSHGVVLVDVVNDVAEKSLRVAVACDSRTGQNGLPDGGDSL